MGVLGPWFLANHIAGFLKCNDLWTKCGMKFIRGMHINIKDFDGSNFVLLIQHDKSGSDTL